MAFWNPDNDEPLFKEPEKIFVKNIETGEMVPIEELDVGGLNSDERLKNIPQEPLILGEGESPSVLIELHFEATNNYTRLKYPVKVKSEKKFAQPWTLKLHKQSTYEIKIKLTTTAPELNIDGIEEVSIEGSKVITQPPKSLKNGEHGVMVKGTWNLPVKAHTTADTFRHPLPFKMVIRVSRRHKFLLATFHDEIQAKIYSENVKNIHDGQALEYLMLGCDLKSQSSGGINYIVGS